jgi:hypothetical protein
MPRPRDIDILTPLRFISAHLPLVILAGLTLNGLAVVIANALMSPAGPTMLMGLSPFQLITALAATALVHRASTGLPRNPWIETVAVLFALVPSSAIAWGGLLLYAGFLTWRTRGEAQIGAALFAGLAATSLWSAVAMSWLATPITTFEALMVANVLSFAVPDVAWSGNVVGPAGGFKLILLPACASADLVPKALLALAALTAFFEGSCSRRALRLAALTAVLLTFGNWARLAAMSVSAEQYELIHGPLGANLFDLYQTALVIAAAYLLIGEAERPRHA